MTSRGVVIDCFPESVEKYDDTWTVVAVDVIRATTSAVTCVATGRRCIPVASLDDAWLVASRLDNPLMVGELAGDMPEGFDLNNSPADLDARSDVDRPAVMLSSSGTRLITGRRARQPVYLACLRNYRAVAHAVAARHDSVAVIGAGSKGSFREEDAMCCAWVAAVLARHGFHPVDPRTRALIEYWSGAPPESICNGDSAAYLRRTGQERDLAFILHHIDDVPAVCSFDGTEVCIGAQAESVAPVAAAAP